MGAARHPGVSLRTVIRSLRAHHPAGGLPPIKRAADCCPRSFFRTRTVTSHLRFRRSTNSIVGRITGMERRAWATPAPKDAQHPGDDAAGSSRPGTRGHLRGPGSSCAPGAPFPSPGASAARTPAVAAAALGRLQGGRKIRPAAGVVVRMSGLCGIDPGPAAAGEPRSAALVVPGHPSALRRDEAKPARGKAPSGPSRVALGADSPAVSQPLGVRGRPA